MAFSKDAEVEQLVSNDQWVKTIDSTSFRSNLSNAVRKDLGLEKLCQATDATEGLGWILLNDNREETLTVSFETPVFINEILVYESLNGGSVVKLEMFESERSESIGRSFVATNNCLLRFRKVLADVATPIAWRPNGDGLQSAPSTLSNSFQDHSVDLRSSTRRSHWNQSDS